MRAQQGSSAGSYDWQFVSTCDGSVVASNGLLMPTHRIQGNEPYDIVLVPSMHYAGHREFDRLLRNEMASGSWLQAQWKQGAWLVANCTGTFLLASTGLLDQRPATTTWWLERQFRRRFPSVDLQLQPVITEVDRLCCAGASASYLLQAIRMIEKFSGRMIAARAARSMLIDTSHTTQMPFLPLLTEAEHSDPLVHRAQNWMQSNMLGAFRLEELARVLGVSERTVTRRFRLALDTTPAAYLQSMRMQIALSLLQHGGRSIDQIALQIGYSDGSSFAWIFREKIGMSPGAHRNMHSGHRSEG
ncbi:AraC family transcriptional regulator [Stenotrophomonas maltophilia]|nr:AraC family transcriptional regulator [Stenotrophomonas maltophilia]